MIQWSERTVSVDELMPFERNPRKISNKALATLKASLAENGYHQRLIATPDLRIIGGHQRLRMLKELGIREIAVLVPDRALDDDEFRRLLVQDNLPFGEFDFDMLAEDFTPDELKDWGMPDAWLENVEQAQGAADGAADAVEHGSLSAAFGVAPFSVLNAREGWWQERKRNWLATGIRSGLGRPGETTVVATEWMKRGADEGGSIFDPVLCELAYRWFSPPNSTVLDPFAGGSVRGLVAATLGRQYVGCDLRAEQVQANRSQIDILDATAPVPVWHCADSRTIAQSCRGTEADFVFSCPPYADLERYSDDPADLSTLGYAEFREAYFAIIKSACSLLKQDRFAAFVVGEVRNKKGNYYDFVGDTIQAFRDAGLEYYNEAILITMVGSLPIRAGKQFSASRKLGKTHQNLLVFVKGDGKKAAEACGTVEVDEKMFAAFEGEAQVADGVVEYVD